MTTRRDLYCGGPGCGLGTMLVQIAKAVNVTVISLDDGPQGYKDFDQGAAKKFVLDPHRRQ